MEDTLAVNQPPFSCQEEMFKRKNIMSTCANAAKLQVHLPDLITRQWSGFSIAPSFPSLSFPHWWTLYPTGSPRRVGTRLALISTLLHSVLERCTLIFCPIRSLAPGFKNVFLCSTGSRMDPTGIRLMSKNGWRCTDDTDN